MDQLGACAQSSGEWGVKLNRYFKLQTPDLQTPDLNLQVLWLILVVWGLFCCFAYLATNGAHWLESSFASLFQDIFFDGGIVG